MKLYYQLPSLTSYLISFPFFFFLSIFFVCRMYVYIYMLLLLILYASNLVFLFTFILPTSSYTPLQKKIFFSYIFSSLSLLFFSFEYLHTHSNVHTYLFLQYVYRFTYNKIKLHNTRFALGQMTFPYSFQWCMIDLPRKSVKITYTHGATLMVKVNDIYHVSSMKPNPFTSYHKQKKYVAVLLRIITLRASK